MRNKNDIPQELKDFFIEEDMNNRHKNHYKHSRTKSNGGKNGKRK